MHCVKCGCECEYDKFGHCPKCFYNIMKKGTNVIYPTKHQKQDKNVNDQERKGGLNRRMFAWRFR